MIRKLTASIKIAFNEIHLHMMIFAWCFPFRFHRYGEAIEYIRHVRLQETRQLIHELVKRGDAVIRRGEDGHDYIYPAKNGKITKRK